MTRKVKVFHYVYCPSSRKYAKAFIQYGKFHSFGFDYEEFNDGIGNFSTAIVELKDGSVINIECTLIKFVNKGVSNAK